MSHDDVMLLLRDVSRQFPKKSCTKTNKTKTKQSKTNYKNKTEQKPLMSCTSCMVRLSQKRIYYIYILFYIFCFNKNK